MKRSNHRSRTCRMALPVLAVLALVALTACELCCSADEEAQFARDHPRLSPATRAVEAAQSAIDPIAQQAQRDAQVLQRTADDVAQLGVPGASIVALVAGAVGTLLGVYNERRRGSTPLNSAITQIVRSVEAAFPKRTDAQKLAMSAIQDPTTRRLVESIKAS